MKPDFSYMSGRVGKYICGVALCLLLAGCSSEQTQTRDEATADGRAAYEAGDYETAYDELHPIAEVGDPLSQWYIARMYYFGEGRERDIDKAISWYERSAAAGAAPAQYHLGRIYDVEDGYRDTDLAIKWYRKAAEKKHADAMHSLGYVYHEQGDLKRAFEWKKRAADNGSPSAQFDVGLQYERGAGVEADAHKAFEFYRRSARQEYGRAMVALAVMYDKGTGVERDLRKVYQWFLLASEQGWDGADDEVHKLEQVLDADALREARSMANEWRNTHLNP